ncbi:uncharacterized protein LOC110975640 isoform X2 [Acanthaster planci]|nr:uncharacterized protein LOC110975640 isoform X2 [Acanthaster planci]
MAGYRGSKGSLERDRKAVEELILDYACKNYMDDVISAIVDHRGQSAFQVLSVPHHRLVAGTVFSIVQREDIVDFDTALHLLDMINEAVPDLVTVKQYIKLTTGLKTKVLLNKLSQKKFDYADVCALLNKYFPKAELKTSGVSKQEYQMNTYQLRHRHLIMRLMLSASEREAYFCSEMDVELSSMSMTAIQQLLRFYVDKLNQRLSVPVIEQIVSEGPHSQISRDVADSRSNCMEKLLSVSFRGPPSEAELLAILRESWEEEGTAESENKTETEDSMEDDDDDDELVSATDIFDLPVLSSETSDSQTGLLDSPKPSSIPQNPRANAALADPSNGSSSNEPVQFTTEPHKNETAKPSAHLLGVHRSSSLFQSSDPIWDATYQVCSEIRRDEPSGTYLDAAVLEPAHPPRLEVVDQQQARLGLATPVTTEIIEVLAKTPIMLKTDPGSDVLEPNCMRSTDSIVLSNPLSFSVEASPQQSRPAVRPFQKQLSKPLSSSVSLPVSKSRIYLSKNGLPSRSRLKRVQYMAADSWSCIGLTQGQSPSNHAIADSIKKYKAQVNRNGICAPSSQEVSESQASRSSDGSQSSSEKSSTSVSLFAGLQGFNHTLKRRRSCSPMTTFIQDDILDLTLSHPFQDTIISEIDVFPITVLKNGTHYRDNGTTSTNNSELSGTMDTLASTEAVGGAAASQHAEQDNTVSSSNDNTLSPDCGSGDQSETAEVRVEVRDEEEALETEEGSHSDSGDSECMEPETGTGDLSTSSCPRAGDQSPKIPCPKMAIVKLKRLSQDSKVRRYLESSSLSEASMSVDEKSQSSDSEDSLVPDSEDEDSTSTSESSSLPCIELRPDSECQLVRRIPTLEQYLPRLPSSTGTADKGKDDRMKECTVRLRKLEPVEIDALTQGKCNIRP